MNTHNYGHTRSGKPITDELIEALADEAEHGYDIESLIARRGSRGRPPLGSGPSTVESFRLDAALKDLLVRRAEADGVATSEVVREALRTYLKAS